MSPALVNYAFYRFFPLDEDLPLLKEEVRSQAASRGLKGTVLLAREGVNGMLSGPVAEAESMRAWLVSRFGLSTLDFKRGEVEENSFRRLLVKIKKELVPVGDPSVKPYERTARRVSPAQLKAWLDEGRPLRLLDARNTYEIEVGTFRGAEHLGLDSSRDFAARAKAAASAANWNDKTLVTFCTGGIRCEKASAVLLDLGLEDVYQLDGGILRYFEEMGDTHYDGTCFVFDWRLAVDGKLQPTARAEDADKEFGRHKRQR